MTYTGKRLPPRPLAERIAAIVEAAQARTLANLKSENAWLKTQVKQLKQQKAMAAGGAR